MVVSGVAEKFDDAIVAIFSGSANGSISIDIFDSGGGTATDTRTGLMMATVWEEDPKA